MYGNSSGRVGFLKLSTGLVVHTVEGNHTSSGKISLVFSIIHNSVEDRVISVYLSLNYIHARLPGKIWIPNPESHLHRF